MTDPLHTTAQFDDGDADASPAKRLFLELLQIDSQECRSDYLAVHCADDALRRRIERMLEAHDLQWSSPLDRLLDRWEFASANGALNRAAGELPVTSELLVAARAQIGPYRIEEKLGEGGMGAVYRAKQAHPICRHVALKLIRPGMDSAEVLSRFEAERQALALMAHPHIAQILDTGVSELGQPYIAMELVDGEPIDAFCRNRELSLRARISLMIDTCWAVQHAHRNGIIHRDLKPSNVLVTSPDGKPIVKVIDFGVAKAIDQPLIDKADATCLTQVVGTPMYMSPEQAAMDGSPVDTRSDVYSLGVMLYKLITGATPFDAEEFLQVEFAEVRRMICEIDPPRPSSRAGTIDSASTTDLGPAESDRSSPKSKVSSELDWIVMKSLEKDPERRYESAAGLADDLQRYLEHQPVMACPPSLLYRSRVALRRHRIALIVATVVSASLLIATGTAVWGFLSVREAWRESLVREQRVNDLLEASRLQSAIRSFRRADLLQLKLDLQPLGKPPRQPGGNRGRSSSPSGSFASLLGNAANPQPRASLTHTMAINDIASSAGGTRAATASEDGSIHLYEVRQQRQTEACIGLTPKLLGNHLTPSKAVAVSPDGETVVSGSDDGHIFFWDLSAEEITSRWVASTRNGVESIVFSADGQLIAVGARYSQFLILDANGVELHRIENDHRHESLVFSKDGRRLFVPTREDISIWDTESGKRVGSLSHGKLKNVRELCWAGPDRQWLVAADRFNGMIVIIDPKSNRVVRELALSAAYPKSLRALRDGSILVATYSDGRALLISVLPGFEGKVAASVLASFRPHHQGEGRITAAPIALRDEFLTAGADGAIKAWSWFRLKPVEAIQPKPLAHHGFLACDELVIYYMRQSDGDRPIRSLGRGRTQTRGKRQIPIGIQKMVYLNDETVVACGNEKIVFSSFENGSRLASVDSPLVDHWVCSVAPSGERLVAASPDRIAAFERKRDASWALKWTADRENTRALEFVNPDHSAFIASTDGAVLECDFHTGRVLRTYSWRLGEAKLIAASHEDGRLLALSPDSNSLLVVDRTTGARVAETTTTTAIVALSFDPSNRVIVTGHQDETIRAFHLPTGQDLGIVYRPLEIMGEPTLFQWSSSGNRLLVRYSDAAGGVNFAILGVHSTRQ